MAEPLMYEPGSDVSRLARLAEVARDFRFGLSYSWRLSRRRTALVVIVPLIESLLPAGLALVLRGLVNATLRHTHAAGGHSVSTYVAASLVLSLALVVCQSLG